MRRAFEYLGIDHRACTSELLATIAAFAGDALVPDGVMFEIACLDPEDPPLITTPPARPYWFLRGPEFHDARIVESDVISIVEDLVPTMDIVTAIVEEALAQPAPHPTSLVELRWEGGPVGLVATNRFCVVTLEIDSTDIDALRRIEARPGWAPARY